MLFQHRSSRFMDLLRCSVFLGHGVKYVTFFLRDASLMVMAVEPGCEKDDNNDDIGNGPLTQLFESNSLRFIYAENPWLSSSYVEDYGTNSVDDTRGTSCPSYST